MAVTVREYETADGKVPFREWLATLDPTARARVQARIVRFETGNLGDHRGVGGGVQEARVMFGPGYRVYFGQDCARLPRGVIRWHDAAETGTKDWLRIFGTGSSRASFSWRPWMRVCRFRLPWGR